MEIPVFPVKEFGPYFSKRLQGVHKIFSLRMRLPYSGLFSWVEIFVKSWERFPELNFVVLNFVAQWDRSRMT